MRRQCNGKSEKSHKIESVLAKNMEILTKYVAYVVEISTHKCEEYDEKLNNFEFYQIIKNKAKEFEIPLSIIFSIFSILLFTCYIYFGLLISDIVISVIVLVDTLNFLSTDWKLRLFENKRNYLSFWILFGYIKILESTIGNLFNNILPLQFLIYPFMKFITLMYFFTNPHGIKMLTKILDYAYNFFDDIGIYNHIYYGNTTETAIHNTEISSKSSESFHKKKKKDKNSDDENDDNDKENTSSSHSHSNSNNNVNRQVLVNEIGSIKSKKRNQTSMVVTISKLIIENVGSKDLQCELIVLPRGDREKEGAELVRFKTGIRVGTEVEFNDSVKIEPLVSLDGELKICVKHSPTFGDTVVLFETLIPMKPLNHLSQEPMEFQDEGKMDTGLEHDDGEEGDGSASSNGNTRNRIYLKGIIQFKPFIK